jgi:primosomal protein N' (replication factor Y)
MRTLFEDSTEAGQGHVIEVALDRGADTVFSYAVDESQWPVKVGQRVEVPFGRGNRRAFGFVVNDDAVYDNDDKDSGYRLKKIIRVVDEDVLLSGELMDLGRWISSYYYCPLGQVLGAMVPAAVKKSVGVSTKHMIYLGRQVDDSELTSSQQRAVAGVLRQRGADCAERGVEKGELLREAQCGESVLKTLGRKDAIRMKGVEVYKSLPAIPEKLRMKEKDVVLNSDQQNAVDKISNALDSGEFGVTCLHGVTDSGKTEVYIRAIERAIEYGKGAIVLLPEIALTAQTVERFAVRFERLAVMHSGLTAGQRNGQWQKIKAGQADVVIGARSAIFAPLPNLGLIVVDEEHEPSYKQDSVPRYHGRDVAVKRAQLCGGHCVLGSATPGLETFYNCQVRKHYDLVKLSKRVMDLPMPSMELVDMKGVYNEKGPALLSERLKKQTVKTLEAGNQAIMLLNRRGYSSFVFCPKCQHTLHCRNCDATVTFHRRKVASSSETVMGSHIQRGYAICHYCLSKTLVPEKCILCKAKMTMIGLGSQRLEEELSETFKGANVARVDSDSMNGGDYYKLLDDFAEGRIDILAGTQMLAKGLHFPNVTLVGVISADTALMLPDFRSNERTFQLLSQVAGRAGRSEKKGVVIVQSLLGDQASIGYALGYDYEGFVGAELKLRRECGLPPYWRMSIIHLRDESYEKLEKACGNMSAHIETLIKQYGLEVRVRGPMLATISRIARQHRMQIIVMAPDVRVMMRFLGYLRRGPALRPSVTVVVDVDPVNLL